MRRSRLGLLLVLGMLAALIPIAAVTPAAATTGELVITGVIDGPLSGGIPKAVELYVASDIADLSIYGVGSANNGGGTDGEEFTFPADAATAGDFIYVASESPGFESFFGFAPNYTSSAMSINGDDAVELFENGSVVDVFGDIGTDGTGEPWEHLDGWAYRVDDTGRDGSTFVLANWTFSGPNALDGETTNATAATPFPIGTYTGVYTAPPPVVVINEIIQNPDAVGDSYGEWFELFNPTAAPIDIDGWTIADDDFDSHVIANGGSLEIPAGGYLVLARDGDVTLNGGVVADYVYGSGWSLSNSADEVVLLDGLVEVDRVNYDNGATFPDPIGASMALSDPALDNNDGANWCESASPFGAGDLGSPGAANDCAPPPLACSTADGDLTLISEIQGDGFDSPLHGQQVTIRGVVTLADTDLDGYFIQEEVGDSDGNPATSEGLFVYDTRPLPLEGETVELTDYVTDFYGLTQFAFPDMEICDVPIDYLEPTPISFPLDDLGREAFESMLVMNAQDLQVTGLYTAYRFGELGLAYEGPLDQPTSVFAPDDPQAVALAEANAENELKVNDRNEAFSQWNPYPWEMFDEDLSAGDTMPAERLVGALGFSFGEYKVEPIDWKYFPVTDDTNERPDAPSLAGGNDVASFNVLNFFNTFGLRGADNQAEFDQQTAKIVDAISRLDAAVVGLMEIENDYEDFYDDDDTTVPSIVTLVEALNAVDGKNTWDYIRPNENQLTMVGDAGLGPDAIAVGIVYQRDRARAVGTANTFDIDALLQGDIDNSRWPLAQTFLIDGEDVTVVVNHFKSKGSSCTDTAGPGYGFGEDAFAPLTGNCDLTRQYAAERLLEWVDNGATNRKTENVLLVGDFNSYEEEAPIEILIAGGYVDLVQEYGDDASTYKFSGRYGRLDYVFASSALAGAIGEAEVWQINSPAPVGYLYYNDPIDNTAHASSDHDPVVISLDF